MFKQKVILILIRIDWCQMICVLTTNVFRDPVEIIVLKEFQKPYFVIAGEVSLPGKIEMRERVTALQAIMLAGGMKEGARSSQVVVFRRINTDTAEVKLLNFKKHSPHGRSGKRFDAATGRHGVCAA